MRALAPLAVPLFFVAAWGLGWLLIAAYGRWLHRKDPDDQEGNPIE